MRPRRMESNGNRLLAHLQRAVLPALILGALPGVADAAASSADPATATAPAAVTFDDDFFPTGAAPKVDLSRFEKANATFPGTYRGDIIVNKAWRARGDIVFVAESGSDIAQPCFDAASLTTYGLDLRKLYADNTHPERKPIPAHGRFCGPIGDYVPGATSSFDSGEQSLSLSVPQIYMRDNARGYVDPSQWESGINAGVVNYNANVYRSGGSGRGGRDQTSAYVGINASLNMGSWHLYHLGSLNWTENQGKRYQNTATYVQHDVPSLQAQFVAGDVFTTGQLMDSVRLRGARLYSDDRMLPQSQRGYAPVVRGIAETSARVVIKQRGYTLKEITVAPGPFVVDDLYPTGYGGDIDVEVIEADGRVKQFTVPFAATPQLLRAGQSRWDIAAGQVSGMGQEGSGPTMLQGTYQRGINNVVTAYGGVTLGSGYQSGLIGGALNTSFGAFSLDSTLAHTRLPGVLSSTGNSVRLAYSKNLTDIGTDFSLATTRFSSSGYLSVDEAVSARDAVRHGQPLALTRERSRLDLTLSQTMGDKYGQIYFTGSRSDYWGSRGKQVNFSAGYSNHWKSINYNLSAQRTKDSAQNSILPNPALANRIPGAADDFYAPAATPSRRETRVFLTVSMPFGVAPRAPMFTGLVNHSSLGGGTVSQATVSGSATEDNRLTYNVSLAHDDVSGTSGSVSSQYISPLANVQGGYSRGNGYNQVNAGMSGSVVAHSGGVTFGPPTGDTIALIHAPDAAGARVSGSQGGVVDSHGYAVMPYLMPYQLNTVGIDPAGAGTNVQFKDTMQNVAPRAGSVVRLDYETTAGRALLIDSTLPDGRPIPFGAEVLDAEGQSIGVTGQASQIFVNNMQQSGVLTVRWGSGTDESCQIQVDLPPLAKGTKSTGQEKITAPCKQGVSTRALPSLPEAVNAPDEGFGAATKSESSKSAAVLHGAHSSAAIHLHLRPTQVAAWT
ncbi:MAG: fimbria/pilus outer membrane usher protein [Rhodanobacter sp.]